MPILRHSGQFGLVSAVLFGLACGRAEAAPRVVADIAPLHSIIASVMEGVGAPELLLPPGASPHDYALRPSQARSLEGAELVVWMGAGLAPWLERPLASLAGAARVLDAGEAPGVRHLPVRLRPVLSEDHGGQGHDDDETTGEEAGGGHAHSGDDPHLWLDPQNAAAIAAETASVLANLDPVNGETYRANAESFAGDLARLSAEIATRLGATGSAGFIVYHDAFQYFENRFGLRALASVVAQEGVAPGAARIQALRDLVSDQEIACAFTEPQFDPALLETVVAGLAVRIEELDPLGAALEPGPELYADLLRSVSATIADCLAG